MRQVQLELLDDHSIQQLAAGERVQVVLKNVTVAEIVPVDPAALSAQQEEKERLRLAARERLLETLRKGYDLGGFKITNRDELYDRD